jgi:hypothetical protein
MSGPMTIEKAKFFYDEIKVTDKYTFSDGWLQSNKILPAQIWSLYSLFDNLKYLII